MAKTLKATTHGRLERSKNETKIKDKIKKAKKQLKQTTKQKVNDCSSY